MSLPCVSPWLIEMNKMLNIQIANWEMVYFIVHRLIVFRSPSNHFGHFPIDREPIYSNFAHKHFTMVVEIHILSEVRHIAMVISLHVIYCFV